MATIYRFIVEGKGGKGGKGGVGGKKKTKDDKTYTLLNFFKQGEKGGVEHNRKLRAINPALNKITAGYWEKGMRIGRASMGLVKFKKNKTTGATEFAGLSWPAFAIIFAFAIQVAMKHHAKLIQKEEEKNKQNFKAMENGIGGVRGNYEVAVNVWSGKISYNQNK